MWIHQKTTSFFWWVLVQFKSFEMKTILCCVGLHQLKLITTICGKRWKGKTAWLRLFSHFTHLWFLYISFCNLMMRLFWKYWYDFIFVFLITPIISRVLKGAPGVFEYWFVNLYVFIKNIYFFCLFHVCDLKYYLSIICLQMTFQGYPGLY